LGSKSSGDPFKTFSLYNDDVIGVVVVIVGVDVIVSVDVVGVGSFQRRLECFRSFFISWLFILKSLDTRAVMGPGSSL